MFLTTHSPAYQQRRSSGILDKVWNRNCQGYWIIEFHSGYLKRLFYLVFSTLAGVTSFIGFWTLLCFNVTNKGLMVFRGLAAELVWEQQSEILESFLWHKSKICQLIDREQFGKKDSLFKWIKAKLSNILFFRFF